jgi:hypothetical protein
MAGRLRRASLLPDVANARRIAPVDDAIPIVMPDPANRAASDQGATEASTDLLCKKGTASAFRSRSRAYDHKDTFEPPQRPSAPPPDIEEPDWSWYKYDGAPPVPTARAKSVSDEDLPTSWYKYETKPVASLFPLMEPASAKAAVCLTDRPPETAATPDIPPPGETLEQPTQIETADVLSVPALVDAQIELPAAQATAIEARLTDAEPPPAETEDLPISSPDPPVGIAEPVTDAPVVMAPTWEIPEPPPAPDMTLPALVSPTPEELATAQSEPSSPAPPDELEAQAVELPAASVEPERAHGAWHAELLPLEAAPAPDELSPEVTLLSEVPTARVDGQDEHGSEPDLDVPVEAAAPPPTDAEGVVVTVPAGQPTPVAAEPPAIATMEPRLIERPLEPEFSALAAVTAAEQAVLAADRDTSVEAPALGPSAEVAVEPAASRGGPPDEVAPTSATVAAAKTPSPAKRAMLARLAVLLERMLSAKQPESKHETPAPETPLPEPASLPAEASEAMPFEGPASPEPPAPPLETETAVEAAIRVVSQSDTDVAASVTEETIDHAWHEDEPEPVPPTFALATTTEDTSLAETPEPVSDLETAASEAAPAETAPTIAILDLDPPATETMAPVAAESAEPVPEAEPSLVSLPRPQDDAEAAASPALLETVPEVAMAPDLASPELMEPAPEALATSEPWAEIDAGALAPTPEPLEDADVPSRAPPIADGEPPYLPVREGAGVLDEPTPDDPAEFHVETGAPALESVEATAPHEEPLPDVPPAVAPIQATPASIPAVAKSEIRADNDKAALVSNLADVIHSVLSTTKFATKATVQGRYLPDRASAEPEPTQRGDDDEPADAALPHPVAIRSRLGRTERALAFASAGMMIAAGYFSLSMWWHDADSNAAPAPVMVAAAAPSSDAWAERARGVTRELQEAVIDTLKTLNPTSKTGGVKSADAQRPRSPAPQVPVDRASLDRARR